MIIQNWKTSDNSHSILDSRNFNLRLFVGNYTDQKEFIVRIVSDSKNYIFNQSNAYSLIKNILNSLFRTLIVKDVDVEIQDQDKKKDNYRCNLLKFSISFKPLSRLCRRSILLFCWQNHNETSKNCWHSKSQGLHLSGQAWNSTCD